MPHIRPAHKSAVADNLCLKQRARTATLDCDTCRRGAAFTLVWHSHWCGIHTGAAEQQKPNWMARQSQGGWLVHMPGCPDSAQQHDHSCCLPCLLHHWAPPTARGVTQKHTHQRTHAPRPKISPDQKDMPTNHQHHQHHPGDSSRNKPAQL